MTKLPARVDESRTAGWVYSIGLVCMALTLHAAPFVLYHSGDSDRYLIPWYNHIVAAGRIHAFAEPFGNYTPTYLYFLSAASLLDRWVVPIFIIKLLACCGAAWMAYAVYRLFVAIGSRYAVQAGLASLLLPTIVLNVSVFGQADTFWVAACILALTAAIQNRLVAVGFWSGIALAFKAQAIFFAPFVTLIFVIAPAPLRCWLIPPFVYIAAMLPAWFVGWPAGDLLTVYIRQARWQPELGGTFISNGASWWTEFGALYPKIAVGSFWIGYVTSAAAVLIYMALLVRRDFSSKTLLAAASLSAVGVPFLLPGMHERFYILADVLIFCLALVDRKPVTIAAAVLMQLASGVPGYGWAFGFLSLKLPAPFFGLAVILLLIDYLRTAECHFTSHHCLPPHDFVPTGMTSPVRADGCEMGSSR